MSDIPSFPKIFAVGSRQVPDLLAGEVEVTEKVDGSQFAFGVCPKGNVVMRSKGKEMYFDGYENMFELAVSWVDESRGVIEEELAPGSYVYGEFLNKPKHHTLAYDRTPANNIIVFGALIEGEWITRHAELSLLAARLGLEVAPLLHHGTIASPEEFETLLKLESGLGGAIIEGIVIKNFGQQILFFDKVWPSFGKYVREQFKEQHLKGWKTGHTTTGKLERYLESFRTEARWAKAVQHLEELGALEGEPKDIGKLLAEVKRDVLEESTEDIKQALYDLYKDSLIRKAQAGLPEWYKQQLSLRAFEQASA